MTVLQCPATMHMHMSNAGIASQPKRGFLVTLPARTSAGARKKARRERAANAAAEKARFEARVKEKQMRSA